MANSVWSTRGLPYLRHGRPPHKVRIRPPTDNTEIFRLFMIYGSMRVFSLLSDIWTWVWAKDLKLTEEEEPVDEVKKEPEAKLAL